MIRLTLAAALVATVVSKTNTDSTSIAKNNRELIDGHDFMDTMNNKQRHSAKFRSILSENFEIQSKPTLFHKESAKLAHRRDLRKGVKASISKLHTVVIAVKQKNLDELERLLNDISDPKSRNYGNHLTKQQVIEMTSNPSSHEYIVSYLKSKNIKVTQKNAMSYDYITAEGTIEQWEDMLDTTFYEFHHVENKKVKLVRAETYSLPANLNRHIEAVFNTVQFPGESELTGKKQTISRSIPVDEAKTSGGMSLLDDTLIAGYVTPALLNNYYNISNNRANGEGDQCVYASLGQTMSPSDLTAFQTFFEIPTQAVSQNIGGHSANNACATNNGADCIEANLDVQYIMAVSQVTPTIFYYWADENDFMVGFVTEVAEMANPPRVISISYGGYEFSLSPSYASTFNTEAMKLSAMGVTLVAASGDDGVSGFLARNRPIYCGYFPSFPASSPYVTAVGGTMGPETGTTEIACSSATNGLITTGGGFSTLYPAQSWQTPTIDAYFTSVSGTANDPQIGYAAGGRGLPDVSLAAAKYAIVVNNKITSVYGTSASAPAFAGMIALVNAKRLAAGKSSLGWVNPSLYALADSFLLNDITSGSNNCVAEESVCCSQGFTAVPGWDPVTGLGSVNYGKFENAFVSLGSNLSEPTLAPVPAPGQPTMLPVVSPTAVPSATPTAAPSQTDGWMYINTYTNTECGGVPAEVEGYATNYCTPVYVNGVLDSYESYSCGAINAMVTVYDGSGGPTCPENAITTQRELFLGCALTVETYANAADVSTELVCSGSSALPLPTYGDYVSTNFYSGTSCSDSLLTFFVAQLDNYCEQTALYASNKYVYPYAYSYNNAVCGGNAGLTETFPVGCLTSGTERAQFVFVNGTNTPNYFTFNVTQTLNGITATTYLSDADDNGDVLIAAVVDSVSEIVASNVKVLYVTASDGNSTAIQPDVHVQQALEGQQQQLVEVHPFLRSMLKQAAAAVSSVHVTDTASDVCYVTYSLTYNIAALGYPNDPSAVYSLMTSQLSSAVSSGAFTTSLQTEAANENEVDMLTVTSTNVTFTQAVSTVAPPYSGGDDDDEPSETTTIVGVIFAVLFVLAIIACACYCCRHLPENNSNGNAMTYHDTPAHAVIQGPVIVHVAPAVPMTSNSYAQQSDSYTYVQARGVTHQVQVTDAQAY